MRSIVLNKVKELQARPEALIVAGYFLACIYFLYEYFMTDVYLFAGLAVAPFAFIKTARSGFSWRYLPFAILFTILAFLSNVLTLYYLSVVFAVLFLMESRIGKVNYLLPGLLIILSPIFKYFVNTLGFPIRLTITELCGKFLTILGQKATVYGNILVIDGNEFAVDPECVGLKMMTISFTIGIMFIAYFSRKEKKEGGFWFTAGMMTIILALNILCNLMRILLLVIFNIVPGNLFHDIAGMICLIVYVVIPLYFISKFVFKKIRQPATSETKKGAFRHSLALNLVLLTFIIGTGFKLHQNKAESNVLFPACSIEGYKKKELDNGVIKFENKNSLVYVKPIEGFYSAEHSPMICWVGSGYKFKSINKKFIARTEVYTGILQKGNDKIYAAWWFDNGTTKTISQLDWRLKVIKGEKKFSLVNVNAATQEDLNVQAQNILYKNIFN